MREPLSILFVSNLYPPDTRGGAEWVVHDLVKALAARGHSVHVLTSGRNDPGDARVLRGLRLHGPPPRRPLGRLRHLAAEEYYDGANAEITRRALRRILPDVVALHAPTGLSHSILWTLGRSGVPLLLHLHDTWLRDFLGHPRLGPVNRRFFRTALAGPWKAVAVSRRLGQITVEAGLDESRVEVVYNGVRAPVDGLVETARENRALFVGRAAPFKGLHVAAETGIDVDHLGGGDPSYIDSCRRISSDRIRSLGSVPRHEVSRIMARYPVLILPSVGEEACPLSILEAMAAGCVPVGSEIGGIPELIRPEGEEPCGLLVPPGDAGALGAAVRKLMENDALRAHLARAGRKVVQDRFAFDRTVDGIENLCASLTR